MLTTSCNNLEIVSRDLKIYSPYCGLDNDIRATMVRAKIANLRMFMHLRDIV